MKMVLGAVFAASMMVQVAVAQTTPAAPSPDLLPTCVDLPAAPAAPDGATVRRQDMEAGMTAYNAWLADFQVKAAACKAEVEATRARYDASVAAFNAANRAAADAGQAWTAEAAEFTARGGNRRDPRAARSN